MVNTRRDRQVIRKAVLAAARHLELTPNSYEFYASWRPDPSEGKPACMWGWVGHFLNVPEIYAPYTEEVADRIGRRWDEAYGLGRAKGLRPDRYRAHAARSLRLFAAKRFPAKKRA